MTFLTNPRVSRDGIPSTNINGSLTKSFRFCQRTLLRGPQLYAAIAISKLPLIALLFSNVRTNSCPNIRL